MKYETEIDIIKQIVLECEIIEDYIPISEPHFFFHIENNKGFLLKGYNTKKDYLERIEIIYDSIGKKVFDTYSFFEFEKKIRSLIYKIKRNDTDCTTKDLESIIEIIQKMPMQSFEVISNLMGARIDGEFIALGDFTIYNILKGKSLILSKFPNMSNFTIDNYSEKSNLIIGIKVEARDSRKAVEIGEKLFESFENVVSCFLRDLSHRFRVGILNFNGMSNFLISANNTESSFVDARLSDYFEPVDLENSYFKSDGHDTIWKLITQKDKNEIEKNLMSSIEWIGKGILENDRAKSFIQFAFAIESMLQQSKEFISPSITSYIADSLAFLLEKDVTKRKEIVKNVKKIYKKRSSIAHGGNTEITQTDIIDILNLSMRMIDEIVNNPLIVKMKKKEELNTYLDNLKYS